MTVRCLQQLIRKSKRPGDQYPWVSLYLNLAVYRLCASVQFPTTVAEQAKVVIVVLFDTGAMSDRNNDALG